MAIATGSSAAANDVVGNAFQLLASPFNGAPISGFGAAIGGYSIDGPMEGIATAEPLWLALRGAGKTVSDDDILALMQKMVKSRQESADIYAKAGRPELETQEREEIAIITEFLPVQMTDDEAKAAIEAAIAETGAASMKDMGKVVAALKAKYTGQMDFAKASAAVKAALAG